MARGLDDRHNGLMKRSAPAIAGLAIPGAELIRKGMDVLKKGIAEEKEGLKDEEKSSLSSSSSAEAGALRRKELESKVEQHRHCRWKFLVYVQRPAPTSFDRLNESFPVVRGTRPTRGSTPVHTCTHLRAHTIMDGLARLINIKGLLLQRHIETSSPPMHMSAHMQTHVASTRP